MAITHEQAAKQAATNAVTALVNVGGAGRIDICDAAAVLAAITLEVDAFGDAAATGIATLDIGAGKSAVAGADGTADNFKVYSGTPALIFGGSVGLAAADLILNNTSILTGQTVAITSFTYNASAS